MKAPLRILLPALVLGGLMAAWWYMREDAEPSLPDERKVAMELLSEKQTGPEYFHADPAEAAPDENGVVWVDANDATAEIDRIAGERKFDPAQREKLAKLVQEASEPHPSRAVGGYRVNLARLNLALDALR